MKKYLPVLLIMVLMAILLASCASPESPKCSMNLNFVVGGIDPGDDVTITSVELTYTYALREDGNYAVRLDNPSLYNDAAASVNERIDLYNGLVAQLYGGGVLDETPEMWKFPSEYYISRSFSFMPSECLSNPNEDMRRFGTARLQTGGRYPIATNFVGDTAYVVISSPMGSNIQYAYPKSYIKDIFGYAFLGGPIFSFPEGRVAAMEITEDRATFVQNELNRIASGGMDKALTFKFVDDDFEGSKVLQPMIARALAISSGASGRPMIALLSGYDSVDTSAITSITYEGRLLVAHGWLVTAVGSSTQYSSNSETKIDDVVRGTIYLVPAP